MSNTRTNNLFEKIFPYWNDDSHRQQVLEFGNVTLELTREFVHSLHITTKLDSLKSSEEFVVCSFLY